MYSNDDQQLDLLGGVGILTPKDLRELDAGCARVLRLISDGRWHTAEEIKIHAGTDGKPASEGLRRLRQIRQSGAIIEKRRNGESRLWEYRMVADTRRTSFWRPEE